MTEHITAEEVPTWTAGWTAGYAAGIKRALADCPTHGVCPQCREGWGHYTPEHGYLPTVQSESGPRSITADPIGWAASVYAVPREIVEGARDHLDRGDD